MAKRLKPVAFRFDEDSHTYWVGDRRVPSTTELLKLSGWVDDTYFTEEGRERGRAVHKLTAAYDLKSLDLDRYNGIYRGYLLGHATLMKRLRFPKWTRIEEPEVHPTLMFGTTADRIGPLYRVVSTVDQKTGRPERWHGIQTAIQVIGTSWRLGLAPEAMKRYSEYLTSEGGYKLEGHPRRADLDEAYRIIKKFC